MSTHCIFCLETTHISWLLDSFFHLQSQQWPLRSFESEKWKCQSFRSVRLFVIPWTVGCQVPPWHSPGKNTGMGSHSIHQTVFLTQGSTLGLLHCRQILYHLNTRDAPHTVLFAWRQPTFFHCWPLSFIFKVSNGSSGPLHAPSFLWFSFWLQLGKAFCF